MSDIAVVLGTRAEIIKMAPVLLEMERLGVDYSFIFTGQHFDEDMSTGLLGQLGLRDFDHNLRAANHGMEYPELIGNIMIKLNAVLNQEDPKVVLAHGDTNSASAAVFTGLKKSIPCAHVEAGLRAFDWTMPEETNRIMADHSSQLLFAPTELAGINLLEERIPLERIFVVGNTIVDVIKRYFDLVTKSQIMENLDLDIFGVLSVHRKENLNRGVLEKLCRSLENINNDILFLKHPYTMRLLSEFGLMKKLEEMENVHLLDGSNYFDVLRLVWESDFILTDSGGLQEESMILDTPCVTLRRNTERPETLAVNNRLCEIDPQKLPGAIRRSRDKKYPMLPNPLGDGHTGERIARTLGDAIDNVTLFKASFLDRDYFSSKLIRIKERSSLKEIKSEVPGYIVGVYKNEKPIFPAEETMLEKGDLLRIVG